MKNISIITLLAVALICNSLYAETTKSAKKTKSTDTNQTMSDEEFMKEFMKLDNEVEKKKVRLNEIRENQKKVDEIKNLLGVDKK